MISFLSHEIKDSGPTGSTPHPNFSGFWMRLVSETAKILSHSRPFFSKGQSQSRIDWRCGCTFKSLTREYTRNEAKPNPRPTVKKCAEWPRCGQSSRQSGGLRTFHTAHRLRKQSMSGTPRAKAMGVGSMAIDHWQVTRPPLLRVCHTFLFHTFLFLGLLPNRMMLGVYRS